MSKKRKDTNCYISFHIKINMDGADVVNLKDDIKMPYLTDPAHLPTSELNFKNIFNALIVSPVDSRVTMKIRDLLEEELNSAQQKELEIHDEKPKDIFLENTETKKLDDKQKESDSSNPSTEGEQGDTEQEHSDAEWEAPDPISG